MNTKITQGPWVNEDELGKAEMRQVSAFSPDGNRVLQIVVRSFNPDSDARIISAAPEMLNALREMVKEFRQLDLPYGSAAYLLATSALAKAEVTP